MSGPLNSIFAAVEPLITANLVASSIVPTYGHSGADRYAESVPPRIVWVPVREDIQAAVGQGGDVVLDGAGNMNLPGSPAALPPLYTRVINVEVDIWAVSRDTVETMLNALVSAVHDAAVGSYGVLAAEWLLPDQTGKDGEVYRLTMQFMAPIIRVAPTTTTALVNTIPETPTNTFHVGS